MLELFFAKQCTHEDRSKNASLLAHHASKQKQKIVSHPTEHGDAQFGPTQKPTNNPAARI
jgi:hypothetical protein